MFKQMLLVGVSLLLLAGCGGSEGPSSYSANARSVGLRAARLETSNPLQIVTSNYMHGAWSGLTVQNVDESWGASELRIAMNVDGNAALVLHSEDGMGGARLYARVYSEKEWSKPVEIGIGNFPSVVIDAEGNALAVWTGGAPGHAWTLLYSRYDADAQLWGPVQMVNDSIEGDFISLTNNGNGDAIVVFRQSNGLADDVYASRYLNGMWRPPVPVAESVRNAEQPNIAMNGNGDALAVWLQEQIDNSWGVYARRFSAATGTWNVNKEFIAAVPDYAIFETPRASIADNGNLAVYWKGIEDKIYAARCGASGAVWTQTVLPGLTDVRTVPLVSGGMPIASWVEFDPAGNTWGVNMSVP